MRNTRATLCWGKPTLKTASAKRCASTAGERPQYYVENNHPAIIDSDTFAQVQEELAGEPRNVRSAGRHHDRAGQILRKVRADRTACLRRMRNAIPPLYLDGGRSKENRMALYQPPGLRQKILHHSPTMEEAPCRKPL